MFRTKSTEVKYKASQIQLKEVVCTRQASSVEREGEAGDIFRLGSPLLSVRDSAQWSVLSGSPLAGVARAKK